MFRGPAAVNKDFELKTVAKIKLSDVNNSRGYELVVTGSGFNDGTTATAWVLGRAPTTAEWWNELNCYEMNAPVGTDAEETTRTCVPPDGLTDAQRRLLRPPDTTMDEAKMGVCRAVIDPELPLAPAWLVLTTRWP